MKKLLFLLLIIVGLFVGMSATCPSEKAHKDALSEVCYQALQAKLGTTGGLVGGLLGALTGIDTKGATREVVNYMVDNMVTVDDYYGLVSVGTFSYKGKDQMVSIGIFGHVFTPSKDQVEDMMDKYMK